MLSILFTTIVYIGYRHLYNLCSQRHHKPVAPTISCEGAQALTFEEDDREWRKANAELLSYIDQQIEDVEAGIDYPLGWDIVTPPNKSIRELKSIASARHIKGYGSMKKVELIAAIRYTRNSRRWVFSPIFLKCGTMSELAHIGKRNEENQTCQSVNILSPPTARAS